MFCWPTHKQKPRLQFYHFLCTQISGLATAMTILDCLHFPRVICPQQSPYLSLCIFSKMKQKRKVSLWFCWSSSFLIKNKIYKICFFLFLFQGQTGYCHFKWLCSRFLTMPFSLSKIGFILIFLTSYSHLNSCIQKLNVLKNFLHV